MKNKLALIEEIKSRGDRSGIVTADRYFREVEGCFNGGFCPIDVVGNTEDEWQKNIKLAESRLTVANNSSIDMKSIQSIGDEFQFDAIVTTSMRDSDRDVLFTGGAIYEEASPLLWQHITMNPIGATVKVLEQTDDMLRCRFVVADTELGRDAIKLVKIGALRISQGFDPIEWEPMEDGEGYYFKKFKIFEVSLVSVPANSQAVITAISGKSFDSNLVNKWKSNIMPEYAFISDGAGEESENPKPQKIVGEGCQCKKQNKAPEKYSHINFKPNDSMVTAAKRALDWRDEHNRGGTEVGIARGRDISNRKELSPDTWKRMKSFFSRHEVDKKAEGFNSGEDGFPSNGRIAWDLWGGDAGFSKSKKVVDQMDSADKKEADGIIEKAGSRISGATRTELEEAMADLKEICDTDDLPRSISVLAQHAMSRIEGLMPREEDESFGDVKKKFFSELAVSEKTVLLEVRDMINVMIEASEKSDNKKAWDKLLSHF